MYGGGGLWMWDDGWKIAVQEPFLPLLPFKIEHPTFNIGINLRGKWEC